MEGVFQTRADQRSPQRLLVRRPAAKDLGAGQVPS